MKHFSIQSILAIILLSLSNIPTFAQSSSKHVIVVTIDGFRPDFYLEDKWDTPNLHAIKQNGVHAYGVNSVFPSVTYPSHTTIVTGVQPAKHGIFYNGLFEKDTSLKGKIYWRFDQIKAPTLWGIVTDAGLKAASVNWPASVGAPVIFNISDVGSMGQQVLEDSTTPSGISTVIKRDVLGGAEKIQVGTDKNVANIAAWVIKNKQPNFMTVHLLAVDHEQHLHGRDAIETKHAVAAADSAVGIIRRALEEAGIAANTLLIVTGDHGFYDVTTSVSPNVWLKQWGLLQNNNNWKARFHTVGGAAFLFLKDKKDAATLKIIMEKLKQLPENEKQYFRLIDHQLLTGIGADPNVSIALSGLNGASFNAKDQGEVISKGKGGTHGYFPDTRNIQTGFLAQGNAINSGFEIKEMNLRDISAIVTNYLGLKMPSSDGVLPKGIFK